MRRAFALCLLLGGTSCEYQRPEVTVTHGLGGERQVALLRFSGCAWQGVLSSGQTTAPHRCLTGEARVYYSVFDPAQPDLGWQGRRSVRAYRAEMGDTLAITLTDEDDERDTDAPGPYGH